MNTCIICYRYAIKWLWQFPADISYCLQLAVIQWFTDSIAIVSSISSHSMFQNISLVYYVCSQYGEWTQISYGSFSGDNMILLWHWCSLSRRKLKYIHSKNNINTKVLTASVWTGCTANNSEAKKAVNPGTSIQHTLKNGIQIN